MAKFKTFMFLFIIPFAIPAQVGIGTVNPQTALHVAGDNSTIRIESLNASNNLLNDGVNLAPIYVNKQGNFTLVRSEGGFESIRIIDANTAFTDPVWVINPKYDISTTEIIYTYTFSLSAPASIEIKYSLAYWVYEKIESNGTPKQLKSNKSRQIKNYFTVNADPTLHGQISQNYYNDADAGASGIFYNNGFGYINLPAGTHTLYFIGDIGAPNDQETAVMFGGTESLLRLRFY